MEWGRRARSQRVALGAGFLAACAAALAVALPDLETPGLYYDEVIQARPALAFLEPEGRPSQVPGIRSVRLFGGWFPVMTQAYMGALKSQLLIPVFALFGATPASLRLTTLAWAGLALLCTLAWSRRLLGWPVALLAGGLLALDPSALFVSRHDWGSFSLGFLCRSAGLALLVGGAAPAGAARGFAAGLCFGLGVYNKVDFAVPLAALALAFALSRPRAIAPLPGRVLSAGLAGLALGAAPMLARALELLRSVATSVGPRLSDPAERVEKLRALAGMLDGSYFHRLMLAGGSFERMHAVEGAAAGPFGAIFAASLLGLGATLLWRARRGRADRGEAFVVLATALTLAGTWLVPRAVRIHHWLAVAPLAQLVVAIAAAELFRTPGRGLRLRRAAATGAVALALAGSLRVDLAVLATLDATGGKGRWSDALARFAEELPRDGSATAVSVDWGFDGPLGFAAPDLPTREPIWAMRQRTRWSYEGTPGDVYLAFPGAYAVFEYGPALIERAAALPDGAASLRRHDDRSGELAFYSIRFARPHRLVYRGALTVELR